MESLEASTAHTHRDRTNATSCLSRCFRHKATVLIFARNAFNVCQNAATIPRLGKIVGRSSGATNLVTSSSFSSGAASRAYRRFGTGQNSVGFSRSCSIDRRAARPIFSRRKTRRYSRSDWKRAVAETNFSENVVAGTTRAWNVGSSLFREQRGRRKLEWSMVKYRLCVVDLQSSIQDMCELIVVATTRRSIKTKHADRRFVRRIYPMHSVSVSNLVYATTAPPISSISGDLFIRAACGIHPRNWKKVDNSRTKKIKARPKV